MLHSNGGFSKKEWINATFIREHSQQFLEAEMEGHLGRDRYERGTEGEKTYRNGYSPINHKKKLRRITSKRSKR